MALDATRATLGPLQVQGGILTLRRPDGAVEEHRVGRDAVLVGRDPSCHLVLDDGSVSAIHAMFVATDRGVLMRDSGSRNGTWIGDVRVTEAYLVGRASIFLGEVELRFDCTVPERFASGRKKSLGPMVGATGTMRAVFERIERAAATDLTVLIQGETGTGKELAARAIHERSGRSGPLVVVDCGAIPASLAEAALFGHERGAFTGALDARSSPFVEASGGTIFLDELGELPLELQPKLLRVLAEKRLKPVGATAYHAVDARVVAATRRDLLRAVNEGAFRSNLYFRVAQVRLDLPPLRERAEDIPLLLAHVLAELGMEGAESRVTAEGLERLARYDWPGNLRELHSAIRVAVAMTPRRAPLDVAAHVGTGALAPTVTASAPRKYHDAKRAALDRFEQDFFGPLIAATGGKIGEVARLAGLERAHVRRYLKRHGLAPRRRNG